MTATEVADLGPSVPCCPKVIPGLLDEGKLRSGPMSLCRNDTDQLGLLCWLVGAH